MKECVLPRDSREYKNLEWVAATLAVLSPNNAVYTVKDTYLDYGSGWLWTEIIRLSSFGGVQVLSPREWRIVTQAETLDDLLAAVEIIRNGEYFNDK